MVKVEEVGGKTRVTVELDTPSIRGVAKHGADEIDIERRFRVEAGAQAIAALRAEENDLRGVMRPVTTAVEARAEADRIENLPEPAGDLSVIVTEIVDEKTREEAERKAQEEAAKKASEAAAKETADVQK